MKEGIYPERLIGDEGEIGGRRLLADPFPREAGAAQELAVGEAGRELQGHVRRRVILVRVPTAGQTHIEAALGEDECKGKEGVRGEGRGQAGHI